MGKRVHIAYLSKHIFNHVVKSDDLGKGANFEPSQAKGNTAASKFCDLAHKMDYVDLS